MSSSGHGVTRSYLIWSLNRSAHFPSDNFSQPHLVLVLQLSPPVDKENDPMVATDEDQDTACLHGTTRKAPRDNFREAQLVEHGCDGGEGSLRIHDIKGAQLSKHVDTQNGDTDHSKITIANFPSTEWPIGEPIPSEALATSLRPPPLEAASNTSPEQGENKISMPEEREASINGLNGTSSHSGGTSPTMSSRSMSLDSTPTVYKSFDDQLRYPTPKTPSISSHVVVNRTEKLAGISEEDLKILSRLRRRVQLLRLQVQGQRVLIESKREEQSSADEKYIKWIRTHHVSKENPGQIDASEVQALETLWKQCQAARDAYGPAADSLFSLEYGLEVEEARLEQIEGRVYGQIDVSQSSSRLTSYPKDSDDDISQTEDHDAASDKRSQPSQNTSQVVYNDYLWRLGNLDLLQERYQGLINERSMLEEEREKRQRVGLDLDSEDLDFLAHFGDTLEPVRKELAEVSADVERLKQLCIEQGLMTIDGKPTWTSADDAASISESGEETQSELPTDHSKPSQHQKPSGNNEPDSRVSDSHGGFGPFINLWLLHKLRSSAMEILLLACYVAARVYSMDGLKWQAEALRLWGQDRAGKNASIRDEEKQYPVARREPSKATVNRISLPLTFRSRRRAKSAF
jgi:hypothetical protein